MADRAVLLPRAARHHEQQWTAVGSSRVCAAHLRQRFTADQSVFVRVYLWPASLCCSVCSVVKGSSPWLSNRSIPIELRTWRFALELACRHTRGRCLVILCGGTAA